jgi:RecA-family ATPase
MVPEEFDTALAQLRRVARGLDVLILDTKAALISITTEVNNALQTAAIERVALVARETGCAILLLSHTAKLSREALAAQRGEGMASRGGGGAIAAIKGSSMILTRPNAGEAAKLELVGTGPRHHRPAGA